MAGSLQKINIKQLARRLAVLLAILPALIGGMLAQAIPALAQTPTPTPTTQPAKFYWHDSFSTDTFVNPGGNNPQIGNTFQKTNICDGDQLVGLNIKWSGTNAQIKLEVYYASGAYNWGDYASTSGYPIVENSKEHLNLRDDMASYYSSHPEMFEGMPAPFYGGVIPGDVTTSDFIMRTLTYWAVGGQNDSGWTQRIDFARPLCYGTNYQEEDQTRKNYLEDWSFEAIWGENEFWYHGQAYTYYPDWWCSFMPSTPGCSDPDQALETAWIRSNYSACPWQAEVANGPLPPTPLDCLFAPAVNLVAKVANGPAACGEGYQETSWGSPSINQDFAWDGGVDGTLHWKLAFRGDYKLLGGPQYGTFGNAYAYITAMASTTPLYVLVNEQAENNQWKTVTGSIPNVDPGNYRIWLAGPDGYIVEWDDLGISNYQLSETCDIQDIPTPTPEMFTNTPNGFPSVQPTGTPFPWTGTPTITRTGTGTPFTGTPSRTPGPSRTHGPTSSPNNATGTASVQGTAYGQTATAWVYNQTPGNTATPYGTPRSTNTSVPGTPGDSTNTPVPLSTSGLPPIQPTAIDYEPGDEGPATDPYIGPGGAHYGSLKCWAPWHWNDPTCLNPWEGLQYCLLNPYDPVCYSLHDFCVENPDNPDCILLEQCSEDPSAPQCRYASDSCGYACIRPEDLEPASWLDYEGCQMQQYFCWGTKQNATAVAMPKKLMQYEPFGSVGEVVDGVISVQTQVAAYDWSDGAASGVNDPISPSIDSLLKAPGANIGDPWAENAPIINLGPATGGMPSGYVDFCGTRLTNVLSARLAQGSCYVLSKFREIGYLPWVQFGINIAAIGMIIRGFLLVIFKARQFGAARQLYKAPKEEAKE